MLSVPLLETSSDRVRNCPHRFPDADVRAATEEKCERFLSNDQPHELVYIGARIRRTIVHLYVVEAAPTSQQAKRWNDTFKAEGMTKPPECSYASWTSWIRIRVLAEKSLNRSHHVRNISYQNLEWSSSLSRLSPLEDKLIPLYVMEPVSARDSIS